jgi:hypothetical protein
MQSAGRFTGADFAIASQLCGQAWRRSFMGIAVAGRLSPRQLPELRLRHMRNAPAGYAT